MSRLLYNFHFDDLTRFQPFEIEGYTFEPIPQKQPSSKNYRRYREIRNLHLNARVTFPKRQRNSIIFKGGKINNRWKIKFIEDLLILISILIERKVVLKTHRKFSSFPTWSGLHCKGIAKNTSELKNYLRIAVSEMQRQTWQDKYSNGFHVRQFYTISDITDAESRFLADVSFWEFLYYCNKRKSLTYEQLVCESLNTKLNFLVKTYLLPHLCKIRNDRFDIFVHLRNQFAHSGKMPIENPKSRFKNLDWDCYKNYMNLFKLFTQALVLKTLGIDALNVLGKNELETLIKAGEIIYYH